MLRSRVQSSEEKCQSIVSEVCPVVCTGEVYYILIHLLERANLRLVTHPVQPTNLSKDSNSVLNIFNEKVNNLSDLDKTY